MAVFSLCERECAICCTSSKNLQEENTSPAKRTETSTCRRKFSPARIWFTCCLEPPFFPSLGVGGVYLQHRHLRLTWTQLTWLRVKLSFQIKLLNTLARISPIKKGRKFILGKPHPSVVFLSILDNASYPVSVQFLTGRASNFPRRIFCRDSNLIFIRENARRTVWPQTWMCGPPQAWIYLW